MIASLGSSFSGGEISACAGAATGVGRGGRAQRGATYGEWRRRYPSPEGEGIGEDFVGWAKRSVPTMSGRARDWWARRSCAFAHPTFSAREREKRTLVEQARDRLFRRGAADRFRDQGGDRKCADIGGAAHGFRR